MSPTFRRYILTKLGWYLVALLAAVTLNFFLPRLVPGNPVDALMARFLQGGAGATAGKTYQAFITQFHLDRPLWGQFLAYLVNIFHGDLGQSFSLFPARVTTLIGQAIPWTIALQVPAIVLGWVLGNVLGALAAYKRGAFDRNLFVSALALSSIPYYALAIVLLYVFAVAVPVFPSAGGYSFGTVPQLSWPFLWDAFSHYLLPFLSLLVIAIGGQAVGMRSMAIYELGSDYVNYATSLGVSDRRVLGYVFRNAMLPQITGLALSLGTLVGGALITEIVFSYPGVGTLLFNAINSNDYPLIQGVTLIIIVAVLLANFLVDIAYGMIDPRIRAARSGER
ncbi:MAG TPA: ABC transporter permease [Trueperaceae bacterium]|nr:ABC transporter permease [Trueperaceae bacterium]